MPVSSWRMTKLYFNAAYQGFKFREALADIETYCMFVGYPRSGHSLVGSLLDAHPNMIIAHEADALKYLRAGFGKRQIFYLLLERSQAFAAAGGVWSGYSYKVPSQWNGRFEKLRIIGDKKGGRSTRRLGANPELLERLRKTLKVRVKLVHVVRNPYDNIATICKRSRDHDLSASIDFYFSMCETVASVKTRVPPDDFCDIRLEAVIERPRESLTELCRFLGTEPSRDYVDACSAIVFSSPHKTRNDMEWNPALIDKVKAQIDRFAFLHGYQYDEGNLQRR